MQLIEQLVTLEKNDLKDITFEGESIYELQDLIQELGLGNDDIIYKTEMYNSFKLEIRGLTSDEEERLQERDINDVLYEEVLTLDVAYQDGFIIHINK